jgi:hypothetical protein
MRPSVVAAFLVTAAGLVSLVTPPDRPLQVRILHPAPGFKLRPSDRVPVRVDVSGGDGEPSWTLALQRHGSSAPLELAAGRGAISDAVVAQLDADTLASGEHYTLSIVARDDAKRAEAAAEVRVLDPAYALIPLNEGNWSETLSSIYGGDASGERVLYAGRHGDPLELLLLHRASGRRDSLLVPVWSTESVRLTSDGLRVMFRGWFPAPPGLPFEGGSGLGFLDRTTNLLNRIDRDAGDFYSADATGRRVVYWGETAGGGWQYFLYDEASGLRRQLTDDPDAIRTVVGRTDCPQISAARPLMSGDGSRVVIITKATLGLVPPDEAVGCRVFTYDVASETWRQAAAFPRARVVHGPALSADGRWLSFVANRDRPNLRPLLLDLETGELHDPAVDVGSYVAFDAVVTGDGQGLVISTRADLDPRVGNADHNLELFYYDFATRAVRQITETTGGLGNKPGRCPGMEPVVSHDGGVITFAFWVFSTGECNLDGPMRREHDGLMLGFVRAVRRRPGNQGPILDPIPDRRVRAGETIALEFTARDPDGDPLSFYAQVKDGEDVPSGSRITDHHDGRATFTWPTRPEHAGTTILRVAVFDEGGGEVFRDVALTVLGSDPPATATPTPLPPPTATATAVPCPGDCDGDGRVHTSELVTATALALGRAPLAACPAAACRPGAAVTVDCLVRAVAAALEGCP